MSISILSDPHKMLSLNLDPRGEFTLKPGILLTAFGSGSLQGESTLRLFETRTRIRFPGVPVRWAFTSTVMRQRLAGVRKKTDSVEKALHKMAFEKFTHVALQPLHVVPGLEYGEVLQEVEDIRQEGSFIRIETGFPLLAEDDSVDRAAQALLGCIPAERAPHEPVLFMGHGSRHASESRYMALTRVVQTYDPLVFLGTIKGCVGMDELLPSLPLGRVWLLPLLAVVGRHALDDMAGSGEQSWKSRLNAAGMTCFPVLQGMVEYAGFADIWLDHLDRAFQRLCQEDISSS